ncbi:MAG: SRPBCC family protein [Acidobacteria bacterium]|nr:SRPBCC family protein [Acidobacteriota bacterium]
MWKGVITGLLIASLFGLGGFVLLRDESGAMGEVLFLLLPFAAGFAVGIVTERSKIIAASLVIAAVLCFSVLLLTGAEGWVCVLMAAPLIAVGLVIGALLGFLFRKYVIDKSKAPRSIKLIVLLLMPLFLAGANTVEQPARRTPRTETFTTTLTVDAKPERVWEQLRSVDALGGSKPFLMRIGLPVPVSCSLEGEGVGSRRTCYFDSGYIVERVTAWNPPVLMGLEITESRLPGRHWLSFKDASYEIRREGDVTVVIRKTTIISRLRPAWYWRRLEGLGVETEHQYLFRDVANKLK